MTTHTKTPWMQSDREPHHIIGQQNGFPYIVARCIDSQAVTAVDITNASMIVRAVNAHDALVEALEDCIMALGRGGANVLGGPNRAQWEAARAALRAAKGEA